MIRQGLCGVVLISIIEYRMHFRSYKSSPIIKFQKKVRFNKKISHYGKRAFNPNIRVKSLCIKTMRLHVLPSVKAAEILQMTQLSVETVNNMEFKRQTHDSYLEIHQIAKQQLIAIKEIKAKIRGFRKTETLPAEQQENEDCQGEYENQDQGDGISRDESISRLYHGEEQSIGCIQMDSLSISFQGFNQTPTQSTYPHTENNILFNQDFDLDNALFLND